MDPDSKFRPRRSNRFSAGLGGTLRVLGKTIACEAHDLSRSGVLLTGDAPSLAPGERVDLTLKAPTGGVEFAAAVRVVRYLPASGGAGARVAVEFDDLVDIQHEALEALIARILEGFAPAPLAGLRPGAPSSEVRKALEAIPLAHRVALGSRASVHDREFLLQETNPSVLDALARNPQIHADEARALAASPHALPVTLEHLLVDARWAADEEIRHLVAIHPRTPPALADRAIANFKPAALRKLLLAPVIPRSLREKILKRLSHDH